MKIKQKRVIMLAIGFVTVFLMGLVWVSKSEVNVEKGKIDLARMNLPESNLSGERCENGRSRPIAVMMSSDQETRPLSGIGEADMVFEMPVTNGGVTRLMAVFQCRQPQEIGSVRSSRLDFIPLAQGLGAVYAHWGGEKEALTELSRGVINNLDGVQYDGGTSKVYYRKKGLKPPHNGFTSYALLKEEMVQRGFNSKWAVTAYPHRESKSLEEQEPDTIYAQEFAVNWKYDPISNIYQRWRNNQLEMDLNLNQPVTASNVVLMKTSWSPISKDYIKVKTAGSGSAIVYKNGQAILGVWEKKGVSEKLFFFDRQGREIEFSPGPTWVEITTDNI